MENIICKIANLTKKAKNGDILLDSVNLEFRSGEIVALVNTIGSEKNSLLEIITGQTGSLGYEGDIYINNIRKEFNAPEDAQKAGIAMFHHKEWLIEELSVAENIFLDRQFTGSLGIINWDKLFASTKALLDEYKVNQIEPLTKVKDLDRFQKYEVVFLKAISLNARILIFDEITKQMSESDKIQFFALLDRLKQHNFAILYVAHKPDEIAKIADKAAILYNGRIIGEILDANQMNFKQLDIRIEQLINGIMGLEHSVVFLSPTFIEKYHITEREQEIIKLLASGRSNQEIGEKLFISTGTVKNHIYKIFQKAGVKSRMELTHLIKM